MKTIRQHFEAGIGIKRVGEEKIQITATEYRGNTEHIIIIKTNACAIQYMARQLNDILDSYETDICRARMALRGKA